MGLHSRSRSRKPERDEFVVLDSLSSAGDSATSNVDNTLLMGFGRSLHVFKVDRDQMHPVGRLEGLRGEVVAARILPCTIRMDPLASLRPCIALIIHGPMIETSRPESNHSEQSEFDPSASTINVLNAMNVGTHTGKFQTTVEIYSLRQKERVATLLRSGPIDPEYGETEAPSPATLSLHIKGRFVVVTSGESGEVFIFEATNCRGQEPFKCIGKTWTSVPNRKSRTWSTSSASSETENQEKPTRASEVPLVSLSHRWLATVPPAASSRSTLHFQMPLPMSSKGPPGLRSHTSPLQPQSTCELDTPLEESRLNKVARDMTQEVLKGARWVGDQGMQAWKNYWRTDQMPEPPMQPTMPQFPPTHAPDETRTIQQTIVSVLDLENMSENQEKAEVAFNPVGSFSLPRGCSFLSFNPTGLSLLTASAKGDVQYIWDLMRMVHGKDSGPSVRQVARFTRVTPANIVEVFWAEPNGERLAVLTDRGTVHLHDLPTSALQWPPIVRPPRPKSPVEPTNQGWSAAISSGAQPLIAAVRSRPLPTFGGFNIATAGGAGAKGGKMVASGISKSVGAATDTVKAIRHVGENRLHIPGSVNAGCVRWKGNSIVVLGGSVQIYGIQMSSDGKKRQSVVGERLADLGIPNLSTEIETEMEIDGLRGFWPTPTMTQKMQYHAQPLSHAEIETSSPYQPFHTDRRVNLFVYKDDGYRVDDDWVFGEDIPTSQITSGASHSDEEVTEGPMENLVNEVQNEDNERQVVITTRRKRGKKEVKDEENFEDNSVMIDWATERV